MTFLKNKLTRHFVCGDLKTNFFGDIIYIIFFLIEIINDRKIYQDKSNFLDSEKFVEIMSNKEDLFNKSPSRLLCEMYLLNWLKNNFKKDQHVNILDLGCGKGNIIKLFNKFFKKFKYYGCDFKIRDEWKNLENEDIIFFKHEIGVENYPELKDIDIIYSQSVFEHVKYDLSGFQILKKQFENSKQIHFLPAPLSFLNYQKHGYRRYSYNSLIKLKKLLKLNLKINKIGGYNAFKYHFNHVDNTSKQKLFFQFLKENKIFHNEKDILNYLLSDLNKSYPIFYSVEL